MTPWLSQIPYVSMYVPYVSKYVCMYICVCVIYIYIYIQLNMFLFVIYKHIFLSELFGIKYFLLVARSSWYRMGVIAAKRYRESTHRSVPRVKSQNPQWHRCSFQILSATSCCRLLTETQEENVCTNMCVCVCACMYIIYTCIYHC